jgi:hypothetical protein
MMNWCKGFAATAMLMISLTSASAAPTPSQKCEAGKNGTAGKYARCLHKAQQKFVSGGEVDTAKRDASILSCGTKYVDKFQAFEDKAGMGVCPSEGDVTGIQDFLDACIFSAEDALGGGTLPSDVVTCNTDLGTCTGSLGTCNGNLATCSSDLSTTNADLGVCDGDLVDCNADLSTTNADLASCIASGPEAKPLETGQTTCFDTAGTVIPCASTGQDGELQLGASRSFTDNGDGTITDNKTGLMWEKLSNDGSIHDKDDTYTWANAFATKVGTLNSGSFAGHNDWRVPNRFELETLVNLGAVHPSTYSAFSTSCPAACTVLTCSCTQSNGYWSSSTYQNGPSNAWAVDFGDGLTFANGRMAIRYVRGVRAGS